MSDREEQGRGKGMAMHRIVSLTAVLLCLIARGFSTPSADAAPSAGDETLLFQDIPSVFGASKYEQKVSEAPSSISIVTAAEIKKYGHRTLADILRSVRSFYISYDRDYSYAGVRGFGRPGDFNSRILVLIDGHRTNDNVYDGALLGTEGIIDVDLIDRIEIIRGPGSSLYGSNAFFAVVNIVTKRGRDLKGAEASGELASYDTFKSRLSYGNRFGNSMEALVSGSVYASKGQDPYYWQYDEPATNKGVAEDADHDDSRSAFAKASYRDLTLSAAVSARTKRIPTGAFGTDFNEPHTRTTDVHRYVDLKYDRPVGSAADLSARVSYHSYAYTAHYLTAGVDNHDLSFGDWWGGEVKLIARPLDAHRVIIGAEYQGNTRQDQRNYDEGNPSWYMDDQRRSRRIGIYAQDEIALAPRIMVNAGLRFDHYDTFGGTVNPRLAFIYNPAERAAVKLLYGSAFRAPSVYELYYVNPASAPPVVSNPELDPEMIDTYEVVYEHYLGEGLRISLSGFRYEIKDLIDLTTDASGNILFRNIDRAEGQGLGWEIENRWRNGVEALLSFTIQKTKNTSTGEELTNSPRQQAKLNVQVPLFSDRLSLGIEEQVHSKRNTVTGGVVGGYGVTNVTLFSQKLAEGLEISASVYNLFDHAYSDPVSADYVQDAIPQDGRNYRFKATYAF